jgi:hypothetical protein
VVDIDSCRFHVPFKAAGPFGLRREEELMRTKAFLRPTTSCAVALAAFVAAAAIGAPRPALAASCGVSSGSSIGSVHSPSSNANAGTHSGATGSTHGTSSSSCSTMSHTTVTASVGGSGLRGTALIGGTSGGHHEHEHHASNLGPNSHTITATNNKWMHKH